MWKSILCFAVASSAVALVASAEPVTMTGQQLDQVVAGKITTTTTQTNGGGNTPQGNANGVPTVTISTNPAGKAPPGQN
jgi:hypothetical protein